MGITEYDMGLAIVRSGNMTPVAAMKRTPTATVKSILGRIGLSYEENLPKEVYLTALYDALKENKDLVASIVPEYIIHFLLEIWENDKVYMDDERWNYAEYLRILGLLAYRRGGARSANAIYVIGEMKDDYYFLLKSRTSRDKMKRYSHWEKMIAGLMYYYGLIRLTTLYDHFVRTVRQVVTYDEFLFFIKSRASLWAFGDILKDIKKNVDYFSIFGVENTEMLLMYLREHENLPYKKVDETDLVIICDGAGIDNRWPGVSETGMLLVNELQMDYYAATVMVRSLLGLIHNGADFDKLKEKISILTVPSEDMKMRLMEAVRLLYDHVPVYEYKGYSRKEFREISFSEQTKSGARRFTVIEGGSRDKSGKNKNNEKR